MSATLTRFKVDITLVAPVLTMASGAIGFGLDAATLRDPQGRPALPGTLVKGNLRQAWEALARITGEPTAEFRAHWLGEGSEERSFDEPLRGCLSFDPWWVDPGGSKAGAGRRYRIQVDEDTGAVRGGALQVIESPYPAGKRVTFSGGILGRVTESEQQALLRWLHKGLQLVPALGALKGNGFGRLERVSVSATPVPPRPGPSRAPSITGTRVGLRIRPQHPFCFARLAPGNRNHFAAEPFIPGGALVAAIKRRLDEQPGRWSRLEADLDRLHISQGLAVRARHGARPLGPPLSLGKVVSREEVRFVDLSLQVEPIAIDGEAPEFAIDWKNREYNRCAKLLAGEGWASPETRLRLRNEIEPGSGTAAKGVLFSIETVLPDGCDWLANLELGRCAEPAACIDELADLLAEPLTHLGKTKATALVDLENPFPLSVPGRAVDDFRITLVLQSPARLLPENADIPPTNGGQALHDAYSAAWDSLSGGALKLSHFYAAQALQGGTYWWNRFRRPDPDAPNNYRPQLFSLAGSVFVLDLIDAASAHRFLADWARYGLPQLPDAPGGESWRYNPWIASNGYGEIALNPDIHALLAEVRS